MTTLALKYRPSNLCDLVGQDVSVLALTNTLLRAQKNNNRIHHQAFLFAGTRGTGKTSTARIFARALNCQYGPTVEPCGQCASCLASNLSDSNLDVIEIDAASRSSVDDARNLREQIYTYPAFCRYRVYILDEAHMMSQSAFNVLLKVLEEPPLHVIFILATTEIQDIPDTIKSRVQIFPFRTISASVIKNRLEYICNKEGIKYCDASLQLLAEAGQGSMRDSLTILDRIILASTNSISETLVREQLGLVSVLNINIMVEALLIGDSLTIIDQCLALSSLNIDWIIFWRDMIFMLRHRMEKEIRSRNSVNEALRWIRIIQLLLQRERDLRDTNMPELVVELALITAAQLPHLTPLNALLKNDNVTNNKHNDSLRSIELSQQSSCMTSIQNKNNTVYVKKEDSQHKTVKKLLVINDFENYNEICRISSELFKNAEYHFPRSFRAIAYMATAIKWQNYVLKYFFPHNVRNTVHEFEQEKNNPLLLNELRKIFPGLLKIIITIEDNPDENDGKEDLLQTNPMLKRILKDTGGEIIELRPYVRHNSYE